MQEQGGRTGQAWHSALAFLQVVNTCALGLYLLLLLLLRSIISIQCQFSPENAPSESGASDCAFSITFAFAADSYPGNAAEKYTLLVQFSAKKILSWRTEFNQTDSFITESWHQNAVSSENAPLKIIGMCRRFLVWKSSWRTKFIQTDSFNSGRAPKIHLTALFSTDSIKP